MKESPDVTSFFLELRNLLDKLLRFRYCLSVISEGDADVRKQVHLQTTFMNK